MVNCVKIKPARYQLYQYFYDNAPQLRDVVIVVVRCTGYCPHYAPGKLRLNHTYHFVAMTVGTTCIFWYNLIYIYISLHFQQFDHFEVTNYLSFTSQKYNCNCWTTIVKFVLEGGDLP